MSEIVDLSVVLGKPKKVRIEDGGTVYTLPAQIPVPLYLQIQAQAEDGDEDPDIIKSLHDQVLALFQVHQPDMDVVPCGMSQLFEIIPMVYGTEDREAKPYAADKPWWETEVAELEESPDDSIPFLDVVGALCRQFHWEPNFWRTMGWGEFTAWLGVLKRQNEPPELSPGSWAGTSEDSWWQEARAERDRLRA